MALPRKAGAVGLVLGTALALGACRNDNPLKPKFVAAGEKAVVRLDCGCFFDDAEDVITESNMAALIHFMAVRTGSAKQQKARLQSIVGAGNVTPVWRASMGCS